MKDMPRIVGVKIKLPSTDSNLSGGSDGVRSFENSQDRNKDFPVIEEASIEAASESSLTESVCNGGEFNIGLVLKTYVV